MDSSPFPGFSTSRSLRLLTTGLGLVALDGEELHDSLGGSVLLASKADEEAPLLGAVDAVVDNLGSGELGDAVENLARLDST